MKTWKPGVLLALASTLATITLPVQAADSVSLDAGYGDRTRVLRAGVQWDWDTQWWKSNGTHIGGRWELSLAHWRGTRHRDIQGRSQDIAILGITPVFRFQNDSRKGFYVEAGIGAHLFSELYDNDGRRLSTAFQFGDHLGIGYVFSNNLELGLRVEHFSNGGIKKPNPGVDFVSLRLRYAF